LKDRRRRRRAAKPTATEARERPPSLAPFGFALGVLLFAVGWGWWQISHKPATIGSATTTSSASAPLNLLLITLDTTRADYLGCYGNTAAQTPELDRLAREGTRFAACDTAIPLTLPAHCTIMTGLNPAAHGVRRNALDRLAPEHTTLATLAKAAGFATRAVVASVVLDGRYGLNRGFDTYKDVVPAPGANAAAAERRGNEVCDDALAQLRGAAQQRFFLWVHFYDPHYPYESSRGAAPDSPAAYAEEITFMDRQIGRLRAALEELRLDRRTLVVVVGDHGEGLGQHGESEHGYLVYESTLHVPLIAWCPDVVAAGRTVAARVRVLDLLPTMLDYLGLPPAPHAEGTSLRPLIAGTTDDLQLAAYGESFTAQTELALCALRSVAEGDWKYILATQPELYDLSADPNEEHNLAAAQPEQAARLRARLAEIVADATATAAPATAGPALSDQEVARLATLGYVAAATADDATPAEVAAALEPRGDSPMAHMATIEQYVRAHRLVGAGDFAAAEPLLRAVVQALPDAPTPLNELSLALRRLQRESEILDVCAQVLAEKPPASGMRLFYARRLLEARRLAEAEEQLATLVEQNPSDADAHFEHGNALNALQRSDEARAAYEQAITANPHHSRALHALAMSLAREKRFKEASDYLRRAIAQDPRSPKLRQDLQRIESELGQPSP